MGQVLLRQGRPERGATPVDDSKCIFLKIEKENPTHVEQSKKARISIHANAGSLLNEEYILSTVDMQNRRITVYNIGSGQSPQLPSGFRENHIAIDDNPQGPMFDKNKFVSRKHAHIGYSEKIGFYLQVEIDGTRLMGKRTRIFRGEEIIEMDNPQVKVPLKDGDIIELGKAVRLLYSDMED